MGLFIVRSKRVRLESLALSEKSFHPTARSAQIRAACNVRKSDPVQQNVTRLCLTDSFSLS